MYFILNTQNHSQYGQGYEAEFGHKLFSDNPMKELVTF